MRKVAPACDRLNQAFEDPAEGPSETRRKGAIATPFRVRPHPLRRPGAAASGRRRPPASPASSRGRLGARQRVTSEGRLQAKGAGAAHRHRDRPRPGGGRTSGPSTGRRRRVAVLQSPRSRVARPAHSSRGGSGSHLGSAPANVRAPGRQGEGPTGAPAACPEDPRSGQQWRAGRSFGAGERADCSALAAFRCRWGWERAGVEGGWGRRPARRRGWAAGWRTWAEGEAEVGGGGRREAAGWAGEARSNSGERDRGSEGTDNRRIRERWTRSHLRAEPGTSRAGRPAAATQPRFRGQPGGRIKTAGSGRLHRSVPWPNPHRQGRQEGEPRPPAPSRLARSALLRVQRAAQRRRAQRSRRWLLPHIWVILFCAGRRRPASVQARGVVTHLGLNEIGPGFRESSGGCRRITGTAPGLIEAFNAYVSKRTNLVGMTNGGQAVDTTWMPEGKCRDLPPSVLPERWRGSRGGPPDLRRLPGEGPLSGIRALQPDRPRGLGRGIRA